MVIPSVLDQLNLLGWAWGAWLSRGQQCIATSHGVHHANYGDAAVPQTTIKIWSGPPARSNNTSASILCCQLRCGAVKLETHSRCTHRGPLSHLAQRVRLSLPGCFRLLTAASASQQAPGHLLTAPPRHPCAEGIQQRDGHMGGGGGRGVKRAGWRSSARGGWLPCIMRDSVSALAM